MNDWSTAIDEVAKRVDALGARMDAITPDAVYKGYVIKKSPFDDQYRISKNGSHVATASSLEAAKREIDKLT